MTEPNNPSRPDPANQPPSEPTVGYAQIEEWREQGTKALQFGTLWIVAGLGITLVTYSNAVSSEFGGLYIIAWGPSSMASSGSSTAVCCTPEPAVDAGRLSPTAGPRGPGSRANAR